MACFFHYFCASLAITYVYRFRFSSREVTCASVASYGRSLGDYRCLSWRPIPKICFSSSLYFIILCLPGFACMAYILSLLFSLDVFSSPMWTDLTHVQDPYLRRLGVSNGLCEHLRVCEQCVYFCVHEQ